MSKQGDKETRSPRHYLYRRTIVLNSLNSLNFLNSKL